MMRPGPNGNTTKAISIAPATKMGDSTNKTRSPNGGTQSSLVINFIASARDCRIPNQPTRLGPKRSWKKPSARRSHQTSTSAPPNAPIMTGRIRMYDQLMLSNKTNPLLSGFRRFLILPQSLDRGQFDRSLQ